MSSRTIHQTLTFQDLGGRTQLTWHGRFPIAEERARVVHEYGADKGLSQTMARLVEYVASGNREAINARASRQRAQGFAQIACAANQPFDLAMRVFPDRIALVSSARPASVKARRRLRRSSLSTETFRSRRRSRGLRLAVSVVRSMARRDATLPSVGGSGRLSDISREN